jgi:putative GTP pyrophosphokinase
MSDQKDPGMGESLEKMMEEAMEQALGGNLPANLSPLQQVSADMLYRQTKQMLGNMVDYQDLMMMYTCAIKEVRTKFDVLNTEFQISHKRNPIESITTRLKRNTSIMEKMVRKGLMPTVDNIERSLNDVAGVRVVCAYIDDIYFLADALIQQDDITLVTQKDYIKNPKPNGYRSLHLIVTVPVFFATGKRDMKVEVQIRTIAMDWWASLEHQLKYKQSVENEEEIMRRLKESAETIARTDEEMLQIRKQIEQSEDIQTEDELLFERLRHFDMPIG